LAGEGLQHQDGNSHHLAQTVPTLRAYDPAFAFEIAVIVRDGLRRMYVDDEAELYYLTVCNEPYPMPAMPAGVEEGILKGLYLYKPAADTGSDRPRADILGSGAILNEALKAQQVLSERYGVSADVWSATSYEGLRRDVLDCERWNLLHPDEPAKVSYVAACLTGREGPVVAASDYLKSLPEGIARWCGRPMKVLGTDGFGRSDSREALRDFFEVDARYIVLATLGGLEDLGKVEKGVAVRARNELGIDVAKANPMRT
jgi:pyruvate dehydrogenase E1 component